LIDRANMVEPTGEQLVPRKMNGQDQGVMMTSGDAVETKAFAASKGYFSDEFVGLFAKNKKFLPLINRGTWARVHSIRQVIGRFLGAYSAEQKLNILSLGAGYDSTYFWLRKSQPDLADRLTYIEIDFEKVVNQKTATIKKKEALGSLINWKESQVCLNENEIEASGYLLIAADVRDGQIIK